MGEISLRNFGRLVGANTAIGIAQKLGLRPPPPPISVQNLIELAEHSFSPLAPVDLRPQNGASGISNNPDLFFRDPVPDTPAAAEQFEFTITHNNVVIDPDHELKSPHGLFTHRPESAPPRLKWVSTLPPGEVTLKVSGMKGAKHGPTSTSTFIVGTPTGPTPPPPSTNTLKLQVRIAPFGLQRSLQSVGMNISGPGAPAGLLSFKLSQDLSAATATVALPLPPSGQSALLYAVFATVSFRYNGLIDPQSGSISGEEDAQVDLAAPASISWSGQGGVALFSVRYAGFSNVFNMTFDGLL